MTGKRPVLLFAFANDREYKLRLEVEEGSIRDALRKLDSKDQIRYHSVGQARLDDIYNTFNDYHEQIHIFHYGGHSDGESLHLNGTPARPEPLSLLLRQQPLKLVFLNGCANYEQVEQLFKAGIPAVIATNEPVKDRLSSELARQFYVALAAGKTIRQAFDTAASYVQQIGRTTDIAHRGIGFRNPEEQTFAWGLYCQNDAALDWQLPEQLLQESYKTYGDRRIRKILGPPPFEPDIFLGREADLKAVHQKLFAGNNLLLLVNGEGGIGKTTLASVYYWKYRHEYEHLAWVFAGENLQEALLTLAIPLQLAFPDRMPNEQRLPLLLEAMSELTRPCLLIIDNANRLEGLQRNYLALRSCPNFHILLTTRITAFEQAATYRIEPLERQTAFELFTTHYPNHRAEEDALLRQILAAVGYNTLVIELLAKNLRNFNRLRTRYHLADLLQDLQVKNLLALTHSGQVMTAYQAGAGVLREEKPEDIIAAMYDLSELDGPERRLLSIFAVLPAENIAFDTLSMLIHDTEDLDGTLLALAQKGWIDLDENNASLKVSPVVQEITQRKNTELLEHCQTLLSGLIDKLDYEPGIGHFINCSYEEAALYARYGENMLGSFQEANGSLALLYGRIGNFHNTTGNLNKALTYYELEISLNKKNCEAYPQNSSYKDDLAAATQNLGNIHTSLGNLDQALTFYEQFKQLIEELYEAYPQNVSFKNGLAISYEKLGETHSALGNLDKALTFYELDANLSKELYEAYPQNVSFKNGLAISYSKLGSTHSALGNLDKALTFFEEETQLFEELYEAYPQNVSFKNGLAISYEKLGDTHSALGNLDNALTFFEERSRLGKELYEAYPQNVSFKNGLAISYAKLGETHSALGNLDKALTFYEQYKQLEQELYEAYPQNVEFKNNLAISYSKLGETHSALGNLDNALTFFEEETQLFEELYEAYPQNVSFKNGLAISYEKLGETHSALGNLDKALTFYEQYKQLEQELYEAYPQNVSFKNNLAISYEKLGSTHSALGNLDRALTFYEQYKQLEQELYEAYPQNVSFKNGLAISYWKLGDHHRKIAANTEARKYFQQTEKLWSELVAAFPAYAQFRKYLGIVRKDLEDL